MSATEADSEGGRNRELDARRGFAGVRRSDRRTLLGAAAATLAASSLGAIGVLGKRLGRRASASAAAPGRPAPASLGPVRQIDAGTLNVGYADVGPANGPVVMLMHGWPYDIQSFAEVAPLLAAKGYRAIVPYLRGYGSTRFLSHETPRNGQQSVVAVDAIALLDALKIRRAVFAGFDWGARTGDIAAVLWPERCKGLVSVGGYLIGDPATGKQPLPPEAELEWWYQFYFATERGRAGYEKYRKEFSKLIWRLASPKWSFDDATFDRTAAAFDNPEHVAIVIHNYRWRQGLADGERKYDELESRLSKAPGIGVPTITLEGDANGAPHAEPSAYASKFTGRYEHRNVGGGVGHNLPQEAPEEFVRAVVDVGAWAG